MAESTDSNCPVCGYLRTGLEPSMLCPECGAEGLDRCVMIVGSPRFSLQLLRFLLLAGMIGFAVQSVVVLHSRIGALGFAFAVTAALVCAVLFVLSLRQSGSRLIRMLDNAWTAHPTGIEVRQGLSREFIPVADIASIQRSESLMGPISVFRIVRRRTSIKGLVGSTPYLYVRGTSEDRRAKFEALRQLTGVK